MIILYAFIGVLVALRKESVDRNFVCFLLLAVFVMSLSARRAWIEIVAWLDYSEELLVALRKESVDRNFDRL